jgi:hypothetical protein
MKRRSFLKNTAVAGLVTWIRPSEIVTVFNPNAPVNTDLSFTNPTPEYAPYTWWHWMNGNITKEGITLDLEAMSRLGLGGFQMFEAGTGIPKGSVTYLSDKWLAMFEHTITECKRLGLEFAMHNCPGWSSSGGPWITPQFAMQQLTWSETTVSGGKQFTGALPQPAKRLNYYQDAAVVAFPAVSGEKKAWAALLKEIRINNEPIDPGLISPNGQFKEPLTLGQANSDSFLDLIFSNPYPLKSLTMLASGNSKPALQYAGDGGNFIPIKELYGESFAISNSSFPDYVSANFAETTSSHYRLTFSGMLKICMLSLSGAYRLDNWLSKANFPGAKRTQQTVLAQFTGADMINLSSVVDLTAQLAPDGKLSWDIPPGEWTVLRIGHTAVGRLNHSAPSTGTGLDCDKFSKTAFDFHWQHVFKNILPLLKSRNGGKVGLLIDSYEMGLQNWTAGFPAEFEKRQEYSLIAYLPALTGRLIGDADMTDRFLRDFRRTQADLMAGNYYGRFAGLCKENGMISYTEPYEGGNFEEMQIGGTVDICMGEFWAGHTILWNNSVLDRTIKLAASIAHAKGQSIVGAESYTAEPGSGKWQQYPFAMKGLGDLMFTRGLTRMIFHRYAHQPHPTAVPGMTMGPWGIHFDRTNTWFSKSREWIKYLTRCQFMLRKGTFVADIAYFTGEEVPGRTINPEATQYRPPAGYDYDLINSDCLIRECSIKNGRLENQHGVRYKVLIFPGIKIISLPVLQKLQQLVDDGLILIGTRPSQTPGVKDRLADQEFNDLVNKLWGNKGKVGRGQIFQRTDIENILPKIGLEPDFTYTASSSDPAINFIHRRENDQDIYFIANRRRRKEQVVCSFRITGKTPELWDAVTGTTTSAIFFTVQKGRVSLPLLLEPSGSVFVVFKPTKRRLGYQSLYRDGIPVITTEETPRKARGLHANISGDFTVNCWIKPETDIALAEEEFFGDRRTDHYAVYPVPGEKYYGSGHAGSGFTVGRNGVTLFERADGFIRAVLFVPVPISGWSKLTVIYKKNVPSVYINNRLIKTGKPFGNIVHPSIGEAYQDDQASYYNGEIFGLELISNAMTDMELAGTGLILPPPDIDRTASMVNGSGQLCIWKNGTYTLKDGMGNMKQFQVDLLPNTKQINTPWMVRFPEGSGAPEQIRMDGLLPLQLHEQEGVRYFSGTADYMTEFEFNVPAFAHQVKLDLGRVEVLAEVSLNGVIFPILWSQPYNLDITSAVHQGINKLHIKVTNLWPNRLIGDENLPEENEYLTSAAAGKFALAGSGGIKKLPDWYTNGQPKPPGGRYTFSTWKHYHKDSPLLASGLLGPVTLSIGIVKDLTIGK